VANKGRLVTDEEVIGFVTSINEVVVDSLEAFLIRAVEDTVERYCKRTFSNLSASDEAYDIKGELRWHGMLMRPVNIIHLKNYPVQTFTSLKYVTKRSEVDGTPEETTTFTPNTYAVKEDSGLIYMYANAFSSTTFPTFRGGNSAVSFPIGTERVLATYTSGYSSISTVPDELKFAVLQVLSRIYSLQKGNKWLTDTTQSEFGFTTLLRVQLTEEEMIILNPWKRPIVA
jgi:hypothetical protein